MRRLGYPAGGGKVSEEVARIIDGEVERAYDLLDPMGVFRLVRVGSRDGDSVRFGEISFVVRSRQVSRMLKDASFAALFMVTIGPSLEKTVGQLFAEDEMTRALVLDAIGSETADAVADKMHRDILKHLAEEEGFGVTPRFSPGYGDWPVTVQGDFCEVCGGGKIGISVNASSLMCPRKSVSAVLGWVRQ